MIPRLAKLSGFQVSGVQIVTVDPDREGQRIDNFLLGQLKGVPKSWVYRVIRKGEVRINGKRCKPLTQLKPGDQVRIPPVRTAAVPKPATIGAGLASALDKAVIFEDDQLMVVNKPPGLAVHGGSGVNLGLIEALRAHRPQQKFLELVHRLDKETSGCIMVAKKRSALKALQQAIKDKQVQKRYWCLVTGHWPDKLKEVREPLLKVTRPSGERVVKVSSEGKASLTQYKVLEKFDQFTLLQASPITGRTHQIRVHCQSQRAPIVGDPKYCPEDINQLGEKVGIHRLFLHAVSLTLKHPKTGETVNFEAPLESKLASALEAIRQK